LGGSLSGFEDFSAATALMGRGFRQLCYERNVDGKEMYSHSRRNDYVYITTNYYYYEYYYSAILFDCMCNIRRFSNEKHTRILDVIRVI